MLKNDTLELAADHAINELLSMTPYTNRPCFAPGLRELGMRLKKARENIIVVAPALRPDVAAFALKMSEMMNIKDIEKGVVDQRKKDKALIMLGLQYQRLMEINIFQNKKELSKILVHIANFSMIAESAIDVSDPNSIVDERIREKTLCVHRCESCCNLCSYLKNHDGKHVCKVCYISVNRKQILRS